MKWQKSPPQLIEAFDAALPNDPSVARRKMFGYPCAFVGGNMFCGLHQDNLIVRLDAAGRAKLLKEKGAALFEPMPGRVMREYVVVPPAIKTDAKRLASWLANGFAYAASLPPKQKVKGPAKPKAATRRK
ncbi:MAG: TfoX/Sxy family protein [Deltaproteobacteria bacterium]|nr:TfoX/Sxy family protein [Deltaproteobacteria bacterium]